MTLTLNTTRELVEPDAPHYEMNLAEFPFALLTSHIPEDTVSYSYDDQIVGKDGKLINRHWEIFPHSKLGFPTPSTNDTLFELFQLWQENNFKSPVIHFGTIYDLIKRRGLKQGDKKTYERVRNDLNLLVGTLIEARKAFWDNNKKAYVDKTFHLFEELNIYSPDNNNVYQGALPFSYITASPVLWQSVLSGALTPLKYIDREQYHRYTDVEKRLALILAKLMLRKRSLRRDVSKLIEQIPLIQEKYSTSKQTLDRACKGLLTKGYPYFTDYRFEQKKGTRRHNIYFKRKSKLPAEERARLNDLVAQIVEVTGDYEKSKFFYQKAVLKVRTQTIYRALSITRQAKAAGEINGRIGSYFTGVLKKLAKDDGVTL